MSDNNDTLELEITKFLVDYHKSSADAIDLATGESSVGVKLFAKVLSGSSFALQGLISVPKFVNAAPEDRINVAVNEGTKWGATAIGGKVSIAVI
ncbi:MAG: hypothetical protein NMNS01_11810 [Nitrosomonas sp.]|nr:MAG: hypothetical protein NMNS01_11810 [Nitrosomonas sp.]